MSEQDTNEQVKESMREYLRKLGLDATSFEELSKLQIHLLDADERTKLFSSAFQEILQLRNIDNSRALEVISLRTTLSSESDRGCSLMAAAYLDMQLGELLKAFLVDDKRLVNELFRHTGALGTFSSRIDLAYSLGLISKGDRRNLHLIRKIRNDFAHVHLRLDFNNESISARCNELSHHGLPKDWEPRHKFIRTTLAIAASIHSQLRNSEHIQSPPDVSEDDMKEIFKQDIQMLEEINEELSENNPIIQSLLEHLKSTFSSSVVEK